MIKRITLIIFMIFYCLCTNAQWTHNNTNNERTFFRASEEDNKVKFGFIFTEDNWTWYVEGIHHSDKIQIFFDDTPIEPKHFYLNENKNRKIIKGLSGNGDFLLNFYSASVLKILVLDAYGNETFSFHINDGAAAIETTTEMEIFDFLEVVEEKFSKYDDSQTIFKVVDEMPTFGACSDIYCSNKALENFITDHFDYPQIAQTNGVEGRVFIRFIIEKDGSINDPKIVRDIGAGCGEAALKIVKAMNLPNPRWNPGRQRGHLVRVLHTLQVDFKL